MAHARATALVLTIVVGCGGRESASAPADAADDGGGSNAPGVVTVPLTHKLDILVVVDGSPEGSDAQVIASELTGFLGGVTPRRAADGERPYDDVHVGIISSSLGSFGTSWCDPANPHSDLRAQLLPSDAASCGLPPATPLHWSDGATDDSNAFVGEVGLGKLGVATHCIVRSVGNDGCSYPQPLEAAYHFLVDPTPYRVAHVDCGFGPDGDQCGTNELRVAGVDNAILAQRAAFLRPDSVLAVVILTAEDDMSLKPNHLNWLPWAYKQGAMERGWKSCTGVPDDFEPDAPADFDLLHAKYDCRSCFEDAADSNCSVPFSATSLDEDVDARPVRNFHMVQRWGFNFLWGRQRYVDGFTKTSVPGVDPSGTVVSMANPIFVGGARTPDLVRVAVIAGTPHATYGATPEIDEHTWQTIVSADPAVRDPHMIPSIAPRAGIARFAGSVAVDPENGGDRDIPNRDELQWACIGSRTATSTPRCAVPDADHKDPLCYGDGHQVYFGATPALRLARVVHDLGASGWIGSVCSVDSTNRLAMALADVVRPAPGP